MFQIPNSNLPVHNHRAAIASVLLLGVAGLFPPAAFGGSQGTSELLGASKKSVGRILGDGQPLVSGLFNEESSESHSGRIGSTNAYRTRIGYIDERSCYAFFMKKTAENFNPIEVIGLLYLCANRADWREVKVGNDDGIGESVFIYRATDPRGKTAGPTYLATLDEAATRLFVYSPEWRPDFNKELWVTPDEAPVHRQAALEPAKGLIGGNGKQSRRSSSKQADRPRVSEQLSGKSSSAPNPKQAPTGSKRTTTDSKRAIIDPKQGVYLPKRNQVVPAGPGEDPKAAKRGKRKRGKQQPESTAPSK